MSGPTYRGHTVNDLTGDAADRFRTYRTLGLSERAALANAVDDCIPRDAFDVQVEAMEAFGVSRAQATRAVAAGVGGGSEAEARRVLNEALAQPTPAPRQARESVPPSPAVAPAPRSRQSASARIDEAARAAGLLSGDTASNAAVVERLDGLVNARLGRIGGGRRASLDEAITSAVATVCRENGRTVPSSRPAPQPAPVRETTPPAPRTPPPPARLSEAELADIDDRLARAFGRSHDDEQE